jgi:hypothetical protein
VQAKVVEHLNTMASAVLRNEPRSQVPVEGAKHVGSPQNRRL